MKPERLFLNPEPEQKIFARVFNNDGELTFYRVLKTMGYPITIEENNEESRSAYIKVNPDFENEIESLLERVRETRGGDIILSAGSGARNHIRELITNKQHYSWPGTESMNRTPGVSKRILYEAFVTAYEAAVDVNPNPELDDFYQRLTSNDIRPLTPEAMGYVLAKTIKYVKKQNRLSPR